MVDLSLYEPFLGSFHGYGLLCYWSSYYKTSIPVMKTGVQ